jgi:ribosomal protein L24E
MKCSNLNCGHGIGLVSYRRGWWRFCSKKCRDDFTAARPRPSQPIVGRYFNWLIETCLR